MVILDKTCDDYDLLVLDEIVNEAVKNHDIPVDEYGFYKGRFHVIVEWEGEDE